MSKTLTEEEEKQQNTIQNMIEYDALLHRSHASSDEQFEDWVAANEELGEIRKWMMGQTIIDGVEVPRLGLLSFIAASTPMYLYSNPEFKKVSNTAFTDGIHTFIDIDFYEQLVEDIQEDEGQSYGPEVLVMHELMHVLFNHTRRLKQFPHDIANQAEDLYINTKLRTGYPQMKWAKTLEDIGLGFKEGDLEKYSSMSEEAIARTLLADREKKNRKDKKQQSQQQQGDQQNQQQGQGQQQDTPSQPSNQGQPQDQPGQGQQGQGQGQSQQKQQKQQKQQGQDQGQKQKQGDQPSQQGDTKKEQQNQSGGDQGEPQDQEGTSPGDKDPNNDDGSWDNNHTITPEDLAKKIEEKGMNGVQQKLGYPSSDNVEEIGKMEEDAEARKEESVAKAAAIDSQTNGKMPGSHLMDAAKQHIKNLKQGKMSWKLGVRQAVMGDGTHHQHSYEEPGEYYHIDEMEELLGMQPYLGEEIPHKPDEAVVCLIDTSGSVSDPQLRSFLSEIFELKKGAGGSDSASEVVVLSADTVLRGEPIEITEENADELLNKGVEVFGRGGTNLEHSLQQTLELKMMKDKKIRNVVMFSDLYDNPPKKENLKRGITYSFVAPSETDNHHFEFFRNQVQDYARVYRLEEGMEVNLTPNSLKETPVNTNKNKRAKKP